MTDGDSGSDEHPWYLDLRPHAGRDGDAAAALQALEAIDAVVIAVHADTVPTLADLIAGRAYVGWTMLVPGSVGRDAIEAIAATAGGGYRATIVPGHPLPPAAHDTPRMNAATAAVAGRR